MTPDELVQNSFITIAASMYVTSTMGYRGLGAKLGARPLLLSVL